MTHTHTHTHTNTEPPYSACGKPPNKDIQVSCGQVVAFLISYIRYKAGLLETDTQTHTAADVFTQLTNPKPTLAP